MFLLVAILSIYLPLWGFALICFTLFIHLRPYARGTKQLNDLLIIMKNLCVRILFLSLIPLVSYVVLVEGDAAGDELATNRRQIDEIDQQIVALINRRATVVDRIGQIKSAAGLPVPLRTLRPANW
jgi:Chorismate mutase type II